MGNTVSSISQARKNHKDHKQQQANEGMATQHADRGHNVQAPAVAQGNHLQTVRDAPAAAPAQLAAHARQAAHAPAATAAHASAPQQEATAQVAVAPRKPIRPDIKGLDINDEKANDAFDNADDLERNHIKNHRYTRTKLEEINKPEYHSAADAAAIDEKELSTLLTESTKKHYSGPTEKGHTVYQGYMSEQKLLFEEAINKGYDVRNPKVRENLCHSALLIAQTDSKPGGSMQVAPSVDSSQLSSTARR